MYKLSATLLGHESDVKGVKFASTNSIASVSRDGSLRLWTFNDKWIQSVLLQGSKYLNSVAIFGASVVCGSQDSTITVISPQAQSSPKLLKSHVNNVCALDATASVLLSGSWDKTAKVWSLDGTLKHTLQGHTQAVWSVLVLSDGRILTGSADHTIRVWEENGSSMSATKVFSGHTDAVRGLCQLDDHRFASCSNDMTVRIWNIDSGEELQVLKGHTSFIYSIDKLPSGELITGAEDRSVRVWKDGKPVQVITQPCVSNWSVSVDQSTGDFAVGGSDYMVRVFSRDSNRWASESELRYFEQKVAESGIGKDQVETVKPEQLSPPDVLKRPGTHEGQVVMIKSATAGSIEAHQWTTGKWVKIGEVVGSNAAGQGQKVNYEGKEYDYVFDVDIEDGRPPLKLPYNVTENPYTVAQRFIERNELSPSFVDQVAGFIIKNSEGVELASQPAQDPYGSRYIPGTTGRSGSSSKPSTESNSLHNLKVLPFKTYVKLVASQPTGIEKALKANNEKQTEVNKLSSFDLESISHALSRPITPDSAALLFPHVVKITQSWNSRDILPALDILRLVLPELKSFPATAVVQIIFSSMDPGVPKHALLGTRAIVNLFSTEPGRKLVRGAQIREAAFDPLRAMVEKQASRSVAQDLAVASLLLNYSVLIASKGDQSLGLLDSLGFFAPKLGDAESCYRALLSLGTVVANNNTEDVKGYVSALELDSWARSLCTRFNEPRFKELMNDVEIALTR